ncbi:MAG: CDP-diacylglycerol--glycerol-3-phosphate 3-phosphatidyltransferase [Magnetococcales bacterium]|nr:CDP-diacylglycerol--glycerol-3-phosphate 3-phosphatidyltransferase [Magnetococcales bacterium]
MIWNLPNGLTALRIILIPFFVGFSSLPGDQGHLLASVFFGLAALTDWADGYVARRQGLLTSFGRFFDPVADKLLVISALVLLVSDGRAPLFLVMIILAREVTVMALRERMAGLGVAVPVSRSGKWKTAFQMAAIIMLLLQDSLLDIPFQYSGLGFLFVSTLFSLFSGYRYMVNAWPRLQQGN